VVTARPRAWGVGRGAVGIHGGDAGGLQEKEQRRKGVWPRRPWRPRSGTRAGARSEQEGRREGERGGEGRSAFTLGGRSDATWAYHVAAMAGTLCAWWPCPGHAPPLGRFTEHVAGSKAISVGHDSGPFAGQIWTWAQKQSCSPHNALQFLFKVHYHKGYGLAINCAPK